MNRGGSFDTYLNAHRSHSKTVNSRSESAVKDNDDGDNDDSKESRRSNKDENPDGVTRMIIIVCRKAPRGGSADVSTSGVDEY